MCGAGPVPSCPGTSHVTISPRTSREEGCPVKTMIVGHVKVLLQLTEVIKDLKKNSNLL